MYSLRNFVFRKPSLRRTLGKMLALSTGMRRGEIEKLTWENVDLNTATIMLYDTKNKDPRRVPIPEPALSMLKEHPKVHRINCNLCFPSFVPSRTTTPFKIDEPWKRLLKKANIENFRLHDLRHYPKNWIIRSFE